MAGSSVPEAARAAALTDVLLTVCGLCLDGAGGECHSPGCAFFICPAVDDEQAVRLRDGIERAAAVAEERATTGRALAEIATLMQYSRPFDGARYVNRDRVLSILRAALASPGEGGATCGICGTEGHDGYSAECAPNAASPGEGE